MAHRPLTPTIGLYRCVEIDEMPIAFPPSRRKGSGTCPNAHSAHAPAIYMIPESRGLEQTQKLGVDFHGNHGWLWQVEQSRAGRAVPSATARPVRALIENFAVGYFADRLLFPQGCGTEENWFEPFRLFYASLTFSSCSLSRIASKACSSAGPVGWSRPRSWLIWILNIPCGRK